MNMKNMTMMILIWIDVSLYIGSTIVIRMHTCQDVCEWVFRDSFPQKISFAISFPPFILEMLLYCILLYLRCITFLHSTHKHPSYMEIFSSWRTYEQQCITNGHLIHVMLFEAEDVGTVHTSALKWMDSVQLEQIYLSLQREFCPMDNVCSEVRIFASLTCFYIMSYLILYKWNFRIHGENNEVFERIQLKCSWKFFIGKKI